MTAAFKLYRPANRCDGHYGGPHHNQCTQVALYKIGDQFFCSTHAKILALELLVAGTKHE